MTETERLSALCQRLGASRSQADTMATQLLKRADQLVAERGLTRERALAELLEMVVKGRAGIVPERFLPKEGGPPAPGS